MTKKPIDYSKSCIYKLCCKDTSITDCYIGSTTNFRSRKNLHKSNCNNEKNKKFNFKVYQFIRDNGGWNNWDMILVEKVNVNDGYELHKQERKYIEELNATLNSVIPTRTKKEYRENNKDKLKEIIKEWRENNKDKLKEQKKEYYENNKDKFKELYENNKDKIKEYYENNKEKIKEKNKEWRENNKDKLSQKIECPICKSIINRSSLTRHQKTKKCMNAK
tara:strand:- start:4078 stop:4737 length:660 start_codon:yes stop_codon:yes gene_type:complete